MNTSIICPHCKKTFEISAAIQQQFDDELSKAKTEQSEALKKEYDFALEEKLNQAVKDAIAKEKESTQLEMERERSSFRIELEKVKQSAELKAIEAKENNELEIDRLRCEANASKEHQKELRERLDKMMEELSKANQACEDAKLNARNELLEKEKLIRSEAAQKAAEDFNTKIREQDETINRLREQLTTAKQVAEQGSQQLQGEILELDIEAALRSGFPLDTIEEVKKGERGSDIRQTVNDRFYTNCGLILWECKNAKAYSSKWLDKIKDEVINEKAQAGVIVFNSIDFEAKDFEKLSDNVWLVKPKYAIMLATLLREAVIKLFAANRTAEGKDEKVERLYQYINGDEFRNRIRSLVESYNELTKQLQTEKKQAQKRWAAQEKIIERITGGLWGMDGDLKGILGENNIALPTSEDNDADEEIN